MGLVSDILSWIGDLVRTLVENLINAITKVSNEAKIARLILRDELARLMENNLFFLGFAIWAVGFSIITAGTSAAIGSWWLNSQLKISVELMLTKLSLSGAALRFQQLRLMSQIAQIIYEPYRSIVQDVYKALGGISSIIYEGTNDMAIFMDASRRVVYNALVLAGADPETSEVTGYLAAEPWLMKVNKRYRRYVENPYLIMEDLEDEVIKPALAPLTEQNLERLQRFEESYVTTKQTVDNLRNLNESLQEWVQVLPEQMRLVVDEKIGGVMEWVEGVLDKVADPILEKVQDSLDVINEAIAVAQRRMDNLVERFPDFKTLLYDYFALTRSERQDSLKLLRALLNKELALANERYYENLDDRYTDYLQQIGTLSEKPIPPLEIPIIDRGTIVIIPDVKYSSDSWFVGEY